MKDIKIQEDPRQDWMINLTDDENRSEVVILLFASCYLSSGEY
jgi:hypothetical protein